MFLYFTGEDRITFSIHPICIHLPLQMRRFVWLLFYFFGYLNLVVAFIAHVDVAYVAGVHRGGRGETRSFALLVCSSPSL